MAEEGVRICGNSRQKSEGRTFEVVRHCKHGRDAARVDAPVALLIKRPTEPRGPEDERLGSICLRSLQDARHVRPGESLLVVAQRSSRSQKRAGRTSFDAPTAKL